MLTEKVTYYLHDPARGDVVVLAPPKSVSSDEFIKRIVGLPGEKVGLKDGKIYIDGQILDEPYIAFDISTPGGNFLEDGDETIVPPGQYFVMGDNRPNSSDSRYWGPITKNEITGRAWVIYWPVKSIGVVKKVSYN